MAYRRVRLLFVPCAVSLVALVAILSWHNVRAQTTPHLSDESLLASVLPPLADGSRPPVHMWARADQADGPGGLPTVFVVTLYTDYSGSTPQEREVINYVQYANGAWTPARTVQPGTLLTDDWAWVSLNLVNLSATATGQGSNSQYTVDYEASGDYNGSPRDLRIEEVYASDLSLMSSNVVSDSSSSAGLASATPTASPTPAASATPSSSAGQAASPAVPSTALASGTSAAAATAGNATPAAGSPNLIRTASVGASAPSACGTAYADQGFNWSGSATGLGAISGQQADVCSGSDSQLSPQAGESSGCLLVGDQAVTLDNGPACLSYSYIQPQGSGSFLVVQTTSNSAATVQPIKWNGSGFLSSPSYTACLGNIAIPIQSQDACTSPSG